MQIFIRSDGGLTIPEQERQRFIDAYNEGKLIKPEVSGHVLASLVLRATRDLSGQFISWDSEECKPYRPAS